MGRAVCKDEQVSNWEAVELTTSQLHYAALDAHCLLGLLDNTVQRLRELHVRDSNNMTDDGSVWPDVGVRGMYSCTAIQSASTDDGEDIKDESLSSTEEAVDADVSDSLSSGIGNVTGNPQLHGDTKLQPFRISLFVKNIPNIEANNG